MSGPPSEEVLFSEAARLAFHFHWPLDDILDLAHPDRRRFLLEVAAMTENGA